MGSFDAVIFDLYETLVTEFDPDWRPQPSAASRLGVPDVIFTDVWLAPHAERMTRVMDFRVVLREVCDRAGVEIDSRIEQIIETLQVERLAAKAKPLIAAESEVISALVQLRAAGIKLGLVSNCSVEEVAAWGQQSAGAAVRRGHLLLSRGHRQAEP